MFNYCIAQSQKHTGGKVHVSACASNASYACIRSTHDCTRFYVILCEMFTDLHPVHALATLVVRQSRPKHTVQKLMTFAFWRYSKFLVGDALGWSSLVAYGLNTHRITAATCYLCCQSYRENERFEVSNSFASSPYLREKITQLWRPLPFMCCALFRHFLYDWSNQFCIHV